MSENQTSLLAHIIIIITNTTRVTVTFGFNRWISYNLLDLSSDLHCHGFYAFVKEVENESLVVYML